MINKQYDEDNVEKILKCLMPKGNKLLDALKEKVRIFQKWRIELFQKVIENEEVTKILNELKASYESTLLILSPNNCEILFNDYVTVAIPFVHAVKNVRISNSGGYSEPLSSLKEAFSNVLDEDNINSALEALLINLDKVLIKYNRINRCIYSVEIKEKVLSSGEPIRTILLHQTMCKKKRIKKKDVYWCGQCFYLEGVKWVKWDPKKIPLKNHGDVKKSIPVYIQDHALQQLNDRINIFQETEERNGLIHESLWKSLQDPRFVRTKAGEHMVEYLFAGHKLGYLTLMPVPENNLMLITTFLFLTMDGTPESSELQKKADVDKNLKKYLGIDNLNTLIFTDIYYDQKCRDFLDSCGCGHLFKIIKEDFSIQREKGFALRMRKKLNL